MTFAELIEEVLENISLTQGHESIARGEIKRRLNLAMREISLHVGIPTHYVDVPASGFVVGPFQLPLTVHPEGVKYAEVVEVGESTNSAVEHWQNREIAILSPQEANTFHPRWENDDYIGQPFLLWNPANSTDGLRPVGIVSAKYRLLVHVAPEPMVADADEPFAFIDYCDPDDPIRVSGVMPAYHRVLSHFVSHEILQRLNDEKYRAFYARYEMMKAEMFSQVQPPEVYLPTMRSSRRVKRYA